MKMKEVCRLTGMTEKTVRYYVERELLQPQTTEMGDRTYTEFSSEDVQRLQRVAILRKAGFSIEAILTMLRTPDAVPAIVRTRQRQLREEQTHGKRLLETFDRLESEDCRSMDALADSLIRATRSMELPAPDAEPDFSRFEAMSQEEKERALQEFMARDDEQLKRGRTILLVFIALQSVSVLISLVFAVDFLSNFIAAAITFLLMVLLYKGYTAVRYFFVVCNVIAIIEECYLLTCIGWTSSSRGSVILFLVLTLLSILLQLATCILFLASKSVKKFMYSRRNG